ncbi:MAG: FAD-binding oxidoreductase [Deltaproteobacteria bacterium]|nr:FAD-binding oxidoreductase [Deltaproteobacteria bacterium]
MARVLKTDLEIRQRYQKDCVMQALPEAVLEARDWQDCLSVIQECHQKKKPVTFCGSQTSMTGSSVATEGVLISLQKKNRILDFNKVSEEEALVTTEPGVVLADLKKYVLNEGFLYPPDPTSYREALVGSTVATNATGEETYRFGPTRIYVDSMTVIKADGTEKTLKRTKPVQVTRSKNTAGYELAGEEIDHVIGSEGTLALIKNISLRVVRNKSPHVFVLVLPFGGFQSCLRAVSQINQSQFAPRALELIGPGAVSYFERCSDCPDELKGHESFLYIKDDYGDDADLNQKIDSYFEFFKKLYADLGESQRLDQVFLATSDQQKLAIQNCRHFIPLKVNEEFFAGRSEGGGKVGSDWWVPEKHIEAMMMQTFKKAQELPFAFLVFAHIGNGHPHWNFLTQDDQQKQMAQSFVEEQCRQAVKFGGGAAGEHGIGKIKKNLLTIQHNKDTLAKMKRLKEYWDPDWIFGRGNILDFSS